MNALDYFVVVAAVAIGGGIAGAVAVYALNLWLPCSSRHRAAHRGGPPSSTSGPGACAPAATPNPGPEVAPPEGHHEVWVRPAPAPAPGSPWEQKPLIDPRELLTAPPVGDPADRRFRDLGPARVTPLVREHLG